MVRAAGKNTVKENKTAKKKEYSAPALEKGLDILELIANEPEGLSASNIALRLNRTFGELFRMLVVLEQRGYLTIRPNTDLYILTLKLFELSHKFPPIKRLTTAAGPILRRLSSETGQSCHLVIYYQGKGHVVAQQEAPIDRVLCVRLGAEVPLMNTCSGHILLAFADELQREAMVSEVPPEHSKISKNKLSQIVSRVRNQGYELIKSAQIQGVEDVGYPIYDHSGDITGALAVPFLGYLDGSHAVGLPLVQKMLRAAAEELSSALGFNLS